MLARMNIQMILKLGIVAVCVVGIFVLAGLGKIDASDALHDIVLVVGGLVVALGISGGLANGADKLVRGQSPETGPAVVVNPSNAPPPLSKLRGFVRMRALLLVQGVGLIVFAIFAPGATCTPAQAVANIVQVAVDVCQEAPNLLPPSSPVGVWVALVCEVVDAKTGIATKATATVLVPANEWNSAKATYLKAHGHLPGGMSAVTP